ncbi:carbohydrate ABC transporter permease [Thermodesulfobacteriota bacterium]
MKRPIEESLLLAVAVGCSVIFSLGPFIWFALMAFKSPLEITAVPPTIIPTEFTLDAVRSAIYDYGLLHFVKNSVIVAGTTTIAGLCIGSPAAYALARLKLPFRRVILLGILSIAMFPQISIAGPVWRIMRELGWLNTYQGLIIPYIALTLPLTVWILASFFQELPGELEEAARVDGASLSQILMQIMLPLASPGIFAAGILTFIYSWNEFFFALLIMTNRDLQTLPVGIALFPGEYTMPWGEISAASTVATVPLILLVVLFQKRIVSGLTAGAVKG